VRKGRVGWRQPRRRPTSGQGSGYGLQQADGDVQIEPKANPIGRGRRCAGGAKADSGGVRAAHHRYASFGFSITSGEHM
jgi:hypothetical protein